MQTKIDKNLPLFKELKVNTDKLRIDLDDLTEIVNENTNKIDKNTNDITNLELKDNDFETRIENLEQGQGGGGTTVEIATVDKAGIVKPDGQTITIEPDGTIKDTTITLVNDLKTKEITLNYSGDVSGSASFTLDDDVPTECKLTMSGDLSSNITNIWAQINFIKDHIETQGNMNTYTLYDASNSSAYYNSISLVSSSWSDTSDTNPITLENALSQKSSDIVDSNGNLKINNNIFGWQSTVKLLFNTTFDLTDKSTLRVIYYNSTSGNDLESKILSSPNLTLQSEGNFNKVVSLYSGEESETFLDINYTLENVPSDLSSQKYLAFNFITENATFVIKKIEIQTPVETQ